MQIGTIIKTYDTSDTTISYKIGKIIDINDTYITCETVKIVQEGTEIDASNMLYTEKFRTLVQSSMFNPTPLPIIEEII